MKRDLSNNVILTCLAALIGALLALAVLFTATPLHPFNAAWTSPVRIPIFISALLAITFLALRGILLSLKMTRRVREMRRIVRGNEQGGLTEKLPIEKDDELGVLADAINQMASSLKKRILELENEKSKLSAILHNMVEGVFAVDQNHEILVVNPSAEAILGAAKKSMLGKTLLEITRSQKVDEMMRQAVGTQTNRSVELELDYPKPKALRANIVGVPEGESGICGIFVFYDITEIRRLENMRREFVANVSHELRTPLTSIKGFIETLLAEAPEDPERSKSFLKIIAEDTERLTRLIDDLLDFSNTESKLKGLKLQKTDLKNEIEKAVKAFEPRLAEKKITLSTDIPGDLPPVTADTDKLRQVLFNLLDNAAKFNKSGGSIFISAEQLQEDVEVSIADTGVGIPEYAMGHIFERFYRVDKSRSREENSGTGLGLAIVKHILEAHGGTIQCESKLGQGSVFSFTLKIVHPIEVNSQPANLSKRATGHSEG